MASPSLTARTNCGPTRPSARRWLTAVAACLIWPAAGAARGAEPPIDPNTYLVKPSDVLLWNVADDGATPAGPRRCEVHADGTVDLGSYGSVKVAGMSLARAQAAIERQVSLSRSRLQPAAQPQGGPGYVVRAGDVVLWNAETWAGGARRTVSGKARVGADGRADLGAYGSVAVAGLTAGQAKALIEDQVGAALDRKPTAAAAARTRDTSNAWYPEEHPTATAAHAHSTAAGSGVIAARFQPPASGSEGAARTLPAAVEPPPAQAPPPAEDRPAATPPATPPPSELPLPKPIAPTRDVPPQEPAQQPAAGTMFPGSCHPAGAGPEAPVPQELAKVSLPPYVVEPPDILLIESTQALRDQPIRGQHLVRPDGTIGLGIYGSVYVAGLTLDQIKDVIAQLVGTRVKDFDPRNLSVDVLAYNSKVYYVITDGGGYGEQVYRFPITGNETVLDAVSQIYGLPPQASKKRVWVARPVHMAAGCDGQQVLPVNWCAITQLGVTATNYQIMPGDRVYVKADPWITFDSAVAKVLSPFERMLGITLLGAETVQTIRGQNTNGNGRGF